MDDENVTPSLPARLGAVSRSLAAALAVAVEHVCAALLAAMIVVVLLSVAFRYVLEAPLAWSEELAKLLMLWIVFLGASAGIQRGEHVTIDFLLQRLSAWAATAVDLAYRALALVFLGVVLWFGWSLMIRVGTVARFPGLGWTEVWRYAAAPVGAALMIAQLVLGGVARLTPEGGRGHAGVRGPSRAFPSPTWGGIGRGVDE
jgi:TRAP-type C4-dicarboxylate transport system permease small subunit